LNSSPNIIRQIISRRMRRAGHVARMGEDREVYRILVGKPEGKTAFGRPRRRMNLREIGWGCKVDLVGSGQGPVAGSCEYDDEPAGSGATELI
jgi:hypothetical protein